MKSEELFAEITDQVIAAIEAGAGEWRMPWQSMAETGMPMSADRRPYRGMNAWWLSMLGLSAGYESAVWGTYKTWAKHGGQVRKGEKGTPVVLWKPVSGKRSEDESRPREYLLARVYHVFAAEQCDGTERFLVKGDRPELNTDERLAAADAYFKAWEVPINERTGNAAFYDRGADRIVVPTYGQFRNAADFYSTVAHEAVHSTGHGSRLDRTFGKRFGDNAYAAEELVAELGAAFWCGEHGITQAPRPDHAAYLSHWLQILRADAKALVTVSSKAQAAVDYLNRHAATVANVAA